MTAFSTTAVRLLLAVLVAAGIGGAIYVAVQAGGDDDKSQVAGQLTQTLTVISTMAVASPTSVEATPTPGVTLEATTAPPAPTGTPDTRVPSMQLPTLDQIKLGADGKYFFEGQGDGCHWEEARRRNSFEGDELVIFETDCPANFGFLFNTVSGEINVLLP